MEIRDKVIKRHRSPYQDFSPTLPFAKLLERHGIRINDETLRMGLMDSGDGKKIRKHRRHRQWGQQKQHRGKRMQMAGSYHEWFEERGSRRILICYIDDAAREMFGRFYDEEQRYLR